MIKSYFSQNFRVYTWTGTNAMIIVTRFQNKQQTKSPLPVDVWLSKTSLLKLLFPVPMSMKLLYLRERCFLSCSCTNGTAETASVFNDGVRQCILCLFTHCFDKWIYLQAFEYSLKIIKARVSEQDPKVKSLLSFCFSPCSFLGRRVLDQHSLVAVGLFTTIHFLVRVRKLKPRGICCLLPQGAGVG